MNGKGRYKFKVVNGVLSWKNDEMDRYMPVSPEILTRVVLLYEKEIKNGLDLWNEIEKNQQLPGSGVQLSLLYEELIEWMEQLKRIFADTDPMLETDKWNGDFQINLN
ncbi:MAG TPA: hypothetical protein VG890_09420 [Puia sp.]|nr:hypothetical protein [Puia sp.]